MAACAAPCCLMHITAKAAVDTHAKPGPAEGLPHRLPTPPPVASCRFFTSALMPVRRAPSAGAAPAGGAACAAVGVGSGSSDACGCSGAACSAEPPCSRQGPLAGQHSWEPFAPGWLEMLHIFK